VGEPVDQCSLRGFREKGGEKRARRRRRGRGEKLQTRGKGSRKLFPRGLRRYSCCGRRGLSCGAVRLSVATLVVKFRPSARPVKVVVGVGVSFLYT